MLTKKSVEGTDQEAERPLGPWIASRGDENDARVVLAGSQRLEM